MGVRRRGSRVQTFKLQEARTPESDESFEGFVEIK
jgi:hypothetical protein